MCLQLIQRTSRTWHCTKCFKVTHLLCASKWAGAHADNPSCPGCREPIVTESLAVYRCFCGKAVSPGYIPGTTPHSCGQPCMRPRPGCPHADTACLCHPGPCPPCSAVVTTSCFCGKTSQQVRCGAAAAKDGLTCTSVCGKPLSCKHHQCSAPCHAGPCAPCVATERQTCVCGRSGEVDRPCGSGIEVSVGGGGSSRRAFDCGAACGRELSCGSHHCQRGCHAEGDCSPCPDAPAACRKICLAEMPCGHRCPAPAHPFGTPCPPCTLTREVSCRCGSEKHVVPCGDGVHANAELLCKRRCDVKLSCGRHRCREPCCPASGPGVPADVVIEAHQCPQVCGKPLPCGKHTCELSCHRSATCPPCPYVSREPLTCSCGKSSIPPPVPCGTKPPACTGRCTRPSPCGHVTPHPCHPEDDCPPCTVLVRRHCWCGQEERGNLHCFIKGISCGRPCPLPARCGKHSCGARCHRPPCPNGAAAEQEEQHQGVGAGAGCGAPCGEPLPLCTHGCQLKCSHEGEHTNSCSVAVSVTCACGRLKATRECHTLHPGVPLGHPLPDGSFQTEETLAHRTKVLTCDNSCQEAAHKAALEAAFGIPSSAATATTSSAASAAAAAAAAASGAFSKPLVRPGRITYPPALVSYARVQPAFVAQLERKFHEFVFTDSLRETALPAMSSEVRQLVHQLASAYGLGSQSHGEGKQRAVTLFKPEPASGLTFGVPAVLLSTVANIGSGKKTGAIGFVGVVRLTGLTLHVKTVDIASWLASGSVPASTYSLSWVDDSNAILFFNEELAFAAATTLANSGSVTRFLGPMVLATAMPAAGEHRPKKERPTYRAPAEGASAGAADAGPAATSGAADGDQGSSGDDRDDRSEGDEGDEGDAAQSPNYYPAPAPAPEVVDSWEQRLPDDPPAVGVVGEITADQWAKLAELRKMGFGDNAFSILRKCRWDLELAITELLLQQQEDK